MKLVCDWPSKFCVSPGAKTRDKIFQAMKSDKIAPDVVDRCPEKLAEVAFPSGGQVDLGKELTPSQTLTPPSIYWEADKKSLYTLCMVDPDAPRTKESNKPNQWNHWTVGNIPGNQIARGQPLVEYLPPCPAKNSPPHRYTYMVYKQPARINFKEPRVAANSFQHRDGFSLRSFAQKYQLGNPIAGNFFKCRWDRSVPMIFQRLQVQPPPFRMVIRPGVSQSNVHSYSYSFSFRN
nr:unknown [Dendroctonus ponderosae]